MPLSRREFFSAAAAPALLPAAAPRRPNFILFVADDLGCHDLGCIGAPDVKTPHIDAIAASGVRFVNWYSNAPVCAPARSAILTGRFPIHAGVPNNGPPLGPQHKTIAQMLKPLGYATGCAGKWHLGATPETDPNAHGFDYYYGFHSGCVDYYSHRYYWGERANQVNFHDLWRNRTEVFDDGQYLTERLAAEAKQFVLQHKTNPFFLYAPFNAVHYPMHAPEKYVKRFPNLEPERRMYAAMLSALDDGVGEVMGAVKQAGLFENTMVIFIGDNGATTEKRAGLNQAFAHGGSNGVFRGFKFSLFDGGMHVPGLMSWPGVIPPHQQVHELAMSMDILPTICKAAGASLPAGYAVDGSDILPVAASRAKSPHPALYWAQGGQLATRRGPWKLVLNGKLFDRTEDGGKMKGDDTVFLSNLDDDPGETTNLRHKHPELVDELSTGLNHWFEGQKAASE